MSDTLTAEVANKVLLADVANILAKAKSGKPLTKYERGIIESARGAEKPSAKAAKKTTAARWTLLSAAIEFGVSRETIRRGLASEGVEQKAQYTTQEICTALFGDLRKARARESTANAIAKERDNKIADGELIPFSEHETWCNSVLLPIRQRLLSLPASQASRCNPADPNFAQQALEVWVNESLPILRMAIRKAV